MIKTKRLEIRPWTEDQAADFFELAQDNGFTLFQISNYKQSSVESAREWIRKARALNQETSLGKWCVIESASGKLLGLGGLTPWKFGNEDLIDITYRLRESAWGKGYGMELAEGLVRWGFDEFGLKEITATITPDNIASKKIADKLGMVFDQKIILLDTPTNLHRLRN
jgi:ribosomal-protein-alanine N-acetyltransferase